MSASLPSDTRPSSRLGLAATTATRVAADLRWRIFAGELQPGQRLKLDELATLCRVSHMPVREALRQRFGYGPLRIGVVVDEHARIMKAIATRDAARAAALAQQHALTAGDDLLARMRVCRT